jgi:predicted metal-dependent hydrolase
VKPHWTSNLEFAQAANANGIVPAYIEPYLIKVMRRVQLVLDPSEEELHRDIEIFIKQEAQHYRQHAAFNKVIREAGYDEMINYEKAYEAGYERFLATKSLRFNLAYSEGFEALGSSAAKFWIDLADQEAPDADPHPMEMWKWHLAEEFEHRTVCFRAYQRIYGRGPLHGYLYRVYGFLYAVIHINHHTRRLMHYLLEKDRESMIPEEADASRRREAAYNRKNAKGSLGMFRRVLSPFYDPAKMEVPEGLEATLAKY